MKSFRSSQKSPAWAPVGLLLALLVLGLPAARAQQKVQVVTRTLTQSWACSPGMAVRVRAEKATVLVRAWDRPMVQVTLRLSARHPERAVAEQDLPVAQYRLQKTGNDLDLVNFFVLPAGAPAVRADLRADYTVLLPAGTAVQVVNTYGQTELADLTGRQTLEQSFGQVTLRNLRGTCAATVRYADLSATNVLGNFTCEASKSALLLLGLGGNCLVRNYYGSVRAQPTAALRKLVVEADRTEVTISAQPLELFDYHLSVRQGPLMVPPALAAAKKGTASHATLSTSAPGARRPAVRVSTSYAPLTVQTQVLTAQF